MSDNNTQPDRAAIERALEAAQTEWRRRGHQSPWLSSFLRLALPYLTAAVAEARVAPVPMILFCPACGTQHVDAANPNWDNPPHKTHRCEGCGHLWRPAEIATEGVADLALGTSDTRPAIRGQSGARAAERNRCEQIVQNYIDRPTSGPKNNTLSAFEQGMDHMAGCVDNTSAILQAIRALAPPAQSET